MHERHGDTADRQRPRLYRIWVGMRERCNRPSHRAYQWYGARGIEVCEGWADSYSIFRRWALANGYRADKSIDRINNDLGYSPENCRWSTVKQQARNKRLATSHLVVEFGGEKMPLFEASKRCRIGYTTLVKRYHAGLRGDRLFAKPRMHTDHFSRAMIATGNGKAKLTPEDVASIRASTEPGSVLARRLRVAESTVSMIRSGFRRA